MVISIIAAAALGFLSGLGVGGGSLLILWLTLICGMAPDTARTVNLMTFLPAAVLACFLRRREIPFRSLWPAIVTGCAAALLSSRLPVKEEILRRGFGLLMLTAGLQELFSVKNRKQSEI